MVLLVIDTQKLITTNALYQFETFVSHEKELIKKITEATNARAKISVVERLYFVDKDNSD